MEMKMLHTAYSFVFQGYGKKYLSDENDTFILYTPIYKTELP